ncbi:hypothetical protein [Actinoplanes sp. NPDC026670]|uniref:hypothetical protein n=1 Tax=Actinoplanes sp. NPDC026670 TaxID=3154700 RepID=UPI003402009D
MTAGDGAAEPDRSETTPVRVPGTRYGNASEIAEAVGAFAGLFFLAAYVIIDSRHLMSNYCFDANNQIVCPISGPDWARPLPSAATLIGLFIGLIGLAVGRPIRTGALIAGFTVTTAALIGSWVIG